MYITMLWIHFKLMNIIFTVLFFLCEQSSKESHPVWNKHGKNFHFWVNYS